jgi:phage-related protein
MKLKPVIWVLSSLDDLKAFPKPLQRHLGFALKSAQLGEKHPDAKPLRGFGGAGVLEIIENFDGNTYRAVYTVNLKKRFMSSTHFRRNRSLGFQPRNEQWI